LTPPRTARATPDDTAVGSAPAAAVKAARKAVSKAGAGSGAAGAAPGATALPTDADPADEPSLEDLADDVDPAEALVLDPAVDPVDGPLLDTAVVAAADPALAAAVAAPVAEEDDDDEDDDDDPKPPSDDEDDEDEKKPLAAEGEVGISTDLVRAYLKEIGKVPLLTAEMEVDLAQRIEAGLFAAEKIRQSESGEAPKLSAALRPRPGLAGRRRRQGQAPPAGGQPAPGRLDRQALPGSRHALPGPHPGGQPRPDPRGREVRLHQGLQVLDLRHLVDPPGDHEGDGRPGPHHPHPGAHGRADQQAHPGAARDAAGARAASPPRRSSPRSST
jgi:hypothetical protein